MNKDLALAARTRQRLTLAVACMAQVMMVLDVLIVTVALPSMQHELIVTLGRRKHNGSG